MIDLLDEALCSIPEEEECENKEEFMKETMEAVQRAKKLFHRVFTTFLVEANLLYNPKSSFYRFFIVCYIYLMHITYTEV